jgi:ferredoxin-type protein NapF
VTEAGGGEGARRGAPLRGARRISQLVFLAGFLLLFAVAAYPLKSPVPVDLYLRADPLLALSAMVSLRKIVLGLLWYALPVTVLSILLGRVFCGWVCPMGTTIDISERVFRMRGRKRSKDRLEWHRLKFYLLIALLVTMAVPAAHRTTEALGLTQSVGLSAVYLTDPMATITRTFTWVGLPAAQWMARMTSDTVTGWSYSDFLGRHPALDRALAPVQLGLGAVTRPAYFRLGLVAFLIFGGIVALGRYQRRFWCRNLCPLGALLGVLTWAGGKLLPYRVRLAVSDKCNRCMRCVNECKVGAIGQETSSSPTDPKRAGDTLLPHKPECIECYSCIAVCPQHAISLTAGYDASAREDELRLDRRRVLGAIGAGVAAVAIPKSSLSVLRSGATDRVLKLSSLRLIRPPGSLTEDEFVTACVRCGECMKVCPTNTLQPAVGEGGLEALGTPVIVPRAGPCTQPCNLCGDVCPTRAIEPFTVEEKTHLYLGTASVDRSTCIAWAFGRECVICDEACSYNAISQDVSEAGVKRPVVNERICVGCGICEYVCPVEPLGAIRVNSSGDRRHLGREEQKLLRKRAGQEQAPAERTEGAGGEGPAQRGSPYPGI